jgi:DNA-binding IclR family transcriptional regulator
VVPTQGWARLSPDAKILVFLLARKAMVALPDVALAIEGAAPREIERDAGIKGGTLRPKLVRLRKEGLLAQDDEGRYYVPTHAVLRAKTLVEEV